MAATDTEEHVKPKFAPPRKEVVPKAPKAEDWKIHMRELPRQWKLCVEDFGLTKGTLSRYAEQAKRGDKKAIEKLEPLKQFYLTLMGLTVHERIVKHTEGPLVGKPVMVPTGEKELVRGQMRDVLRIEKETRSVYGVREGYDLSVNEESRKPVPGQNYLKVKAHFYDLAALLEFVKLAKQTKFYGQKHPYADEFEKAHAFLVSGGCVSSKAFAGGKKELEAAIRAVIENTEDPMRRDILEMLIPYLCSGAQSTWDGRD